ncbi:MAG: FkbM family methyltransferase [Planctomycetota bacterium]
MGFIITKLKNIYYLLQKGILPLFERLLFEIRAITQTRHNILRKRINGVIFEFDLGYAPTIRQMLLEKYELPVQRVMKKILKPGDIFIDVGANIGYLSAIGAGLVGKTGQVHSFEPVPEYFQSLNRMANLNQDYRIIANQSAIGETEGTANINVVNTRKWHNIGAHSMVPGIIQKENLSAKIQVPVCRLDNYIEKHSLRNISLIKIDVEGFELPVLKGLENFFRSGSQLPQILCEITPSAYPKLGFKVTDLLDYMESAGYLPYSLSEPHSKINNYYIAISKELFEVLFRPIKNLTQ